MKKVLVETVYSFLHRYVVEVPDDAPHTWATDAVVCDEADEFSQYALGEHILSTREVSDEELRPLYLEHNPSFDTWSTDTIIKVGVTPWRGQDD